MNELIQVAKGQDGTIELRIPAGDGYGRPVSVTLTGDALAAATLLSIQSDHEALAVDDMLIVGQNVVLRVNATCAAGAVSLTVDAIPGPLHAGDVLEKLQDLTSYTVSLEVLEQRGDATPIITLAGSVPSQTTAANRGKVTFAVVALDTSPATVEAKTYYAAAWRTNAGTTRPLWEGDVKIVEKGRL